MDCEIYKKKAILGVILLVSIIFIPNFHGILFWITPIGAFILGIYGLILLLPYIKCLSENNKKLKPPFS